MTSSMSASAIDNSAAGAEDRQPDEFYAMQERVRGTTINEETLLATDYLNHFNEIIMVLELVPSMPDLIDEAKAWSPKSYQEYFEDSSYYEKDLAIQAYHHVPERNRQPFEKAISQLNQLLIATIKRLENNIAADQVDRLGESVKRVSVFLSRLVDHASANIHGSDVVVDQSEIDHLIGGE